LGGKLGSSLIFYFVAIDDPLSVIRDKCMPKPILAWAQVPQRVNSCIQVYQKKVDDFETALNFTNPFMS
jgi:hypothetical protein